MRIRNPARSTTCTHIQCFDIQFFLQMNEKKPTWVSYSDHQLNDLLILRLFILITPLNQICPGQYYSLCLPLPPHPKLLFRSL